MYIEYPATIGFYKPDWVNETNKILVETKGIFSGADRKKALLVKHYFPDWLHIFVFGRPNNKLSKKSKTTYANWCDTNGIPWLSIDDLWENPKCLSAMIRKHRNGI